MSLDRADQPKADQPKADSPEKNQASQSSEPRVEIKSSDKQPTTEHLKSLQQECAANLPQDTAAAKRDLHTLIEARRTGQSTYTSIALGGRVELTDGDKTLIKGFRTTDLQAQVQAAALTGQGVEAKNPVAPGTGEKSVAQGGDRSLPVPDLNSIYANNPSAALQSIIKESGAPVDRSQLASARGGRDDVVYQITDGERIGSRDQLAPREAPRLEMPTTDQLKHMPLTQLREALFHNREAVHDYLRANQDRLPSLIGFHGGTKESNDLWIGTQGKELVPPGARSGNMENHTWVEAISTRTRDVAQLASDMGHAFMVASGFANPNWIKEKFTPGGVSVIDLSGQGLREREQHYGNVEKGRIDADRNFDRNYKGTIDFERSNPYDTFRNDFMPGEENLERRFIATEFCKQSMVVDTIALIVGQPPPESSGLRQPDAPKFAVMPEGAVQKEPPWLAKEAWDDYVRKMPEPFRNITNWNQLRELMIEHHHQAYAHPGQESGSGEAYILPVTNPNQGSGEKHILPVTNPNQGAGEAYILPVTNPNQGAGEADILPVTDPGQGRQQFQPELPVDNHQQQQPGAQKEPPWLAKEPWDDYVRKMPEKLRNITDWNQLRELLLGKHHHGEHPPQDSRGGGADGEAHILPAKPGDVRTNFPKTGSPDGEAHILPVTNPRSNFPESKPHSPTNDGAPPARTHQPVESGPPAHPRSPVGEGPPAHPRSPVGEGPPHRPEFNREAAWEKVSHSWDLSGEMGKFKHMSNSEMNKAIDDAIHDTQKAGQDTHPWYTFKRDLVVAGLLHPEAPPGYVSPEVDRQAAWGKIGERYDISGEMERLTHMSESELRRTVNEAIRDTQRAGMYDDNHHWQNFKRDLIKAGLLRPDEPMIKEKVKKMEPPSMSLY